MRKNKLGIWVLMAMLLVSAAFADTATIRPNAQGANTGWANTGCSSGSSEWQCVDEDSPDTSDYLSTTGTGRETFQFEDPSLPSGSTVNSVTLYYYAQWQTSSSNSCFVTTNRQGGVNYDGATSICVTSTYALYNQTQNVNPATGSAWTISEIDGLEAGMKGNNPNGGGRVAQVYAVVDYTPPAFDFAMSASPKSAFIAQATSATSMINVSLLSGTSEIVNLSVSGCPSFTTCTLSVTSGMPTFTASLNVTTTGSTPTGLHQIAIIGNSASLQRQTGFNVTVFDTLVSAAILASPTSGPAPLQVNFTGLALSGNGPFSYLWDLGDGTNSTAQNLTHTYLSPGNFTATLYVTDFDGDVGLNFTAISVS